MQRFTKVVLFLLVGLVLLLPAIERVDFWDNLPVTGQDLELTEISLLVMVGLVLSLRFVRLTLRMILRALAERVAALVEGLNSRVSDSLFQLARPSASPPPIVSLRI